MTRLLIIAILIGSIWTTGCTTTIRKETVRQIPKDQLQREWMQHEREVRLKGEQG